MFPQLYIGPMSFCTVDAVLQLKNVGFIPSRRQVEYIGGYTGFSTKSFADYVNDQAIIERDHGGPGQGDESHLMSLHYDAEYFSIIHIDPWKTVNSIGEGALRTLELIEFCNYINPDLRYEIGTEESIYKFSLDGYVTFLSFLQTNLPTELYRKILYVVVQSGVGLDLINRKNIGIFSADKLSSQIEIIKSRGFLCKEHNGDYLSNAEIADRFSYGVDAINIAPEFGQLESKMLFDAAESSAIDEWISICEQHSYAWNKWGTPSSSEEIILLGGHYTFDDPLFIELRKKIPLDQEVIIECMKNRMLQILNAIKYLR